MISPSPKLFPTPPPSPPINSSSSPPPPPPNPSQVTANGVISLNASFMDYIAKKFPCTSCTGNIIICPFWADLDTTINGTISHNNGTLNRRIAARVTQLIQEIFQYNFSPSGTFISTWDELPHHNAQHNRTLLSMVSKTKGTITLPNYRTVQ